MKSPQNPIRIVHLIAFFLLFVTSTFSGLFSLFPSLFDSVYCALLGNGDIQPALKNHVRK